MINTSRCIFRSTNLIVTHAIGSYLYTNNDRKVLDLTSGVGSNILGYSHPRMLEVIHKQANKLIHAQQHCCLPSTLSPLIQRLQNTVPEYLNSYIFALSDQKLLIML